MSKIKVIVVDDSALIRQLLSSIINSQSDMECIGTASDPLVAREIIREKDPDVITLDVEMPKMDGIDFLGRLMRLRPMPVVMVSTLTQAGAEVTLRALELGAVDFVAKPQIGQTEGIRALADQIVDKLRIAAAARVRRSAAVTAGSPGTAQATGPSSASAVAASPFSPGARLPAPSAPSGTAKPSAASAPSRQLVAIGASTGGTEAIREVLLALPADAPAVVIAQHMPPRFTQSFAQRLDAQCSMRVREAVDGEVLLHGHAYVAPGGQHLAVEARGNTLVARVLDTEPVNRHKPSVDVLLQSVARSAGARAVGVLLTGMGSDGAQGLLEMRNHGSHNYVQDEASCVVFGMPREALRLNAAHEVLPPRQIGAALLERLRCPA